MSTLHQKLRIERLARVDGAIIDTALASGLNLLSVFVIGALYGLQNLGEFSLTLIYSSLVYLFAYNFIIIPATSKSWSVPDHIFVQKVMIIALIAFGPLVCAILAIDYSMLGFSSQSVFLNFIYIVAHNAYLTLRRLVLHFGLAKYPTLTPLLGLVAVSVLAAMDAVSYPTFLLIYSISFLATIAVLVLRRPTRSLLPDVALALGFLRFSRWMAFGIWFQWLSGNLVQLLVHYHTGVESLGALRILLSSFGFLSIYFQYQEIVLARTHRNDANPKFNFSSALKLRLYALPSVLIFLCLPVYLVYCYVVATTPLWQVAIVYAIYQLLVLVSIIMRVYLRLMKDLQFATVGYVGMVITVIGIELLNTQVFDLMAASFMYLASISVMVVVLAIGLLKIGKR